MVSIATKCVAFLSGVMAMELAARDVFIIKTENHLRCRKLCMYQEACNRFHFKNKQCVLINDPASIHGEMVNKSEGDSGVCDEDEVCVPTGIIEPGYRCEMVLGVNLIGLKGFRIYTRGVNFDKAVQYCEKQGGQLFVVANHSQWQTIADLAISDDILAGTGLQGLWVNGNDRKVNGSFVTTSGDPMPFTRWGPRKPSYYNSLGKTLDCIQLKKFDYEMKDTRCWLRNKGFICEWQLF